MAEEVNPAEAPGWVHLTVTHRPGCLHKPSSEVLLLSAEDLEKWNRRAAPVLQPLTNEQISNLHERLMLTPRKADIWNYARAIERAHGIVGAAHD